ncbi:MAG: bifunctional diaminohydroxyphosphoribosylaminopyrimidine deaminase/5-amino-6-(5-phosphoribosylamino)uracil reductase RibD [Spirochaetia bacterium]
MTDREIMKNVLKLAEKGTGFVSPNPLVGSIIVKNGRIIGEGYHKYYGGKHAETNAIESALEPVEGAALYCNLEPCSHTGKGKHQPPCTSRIIQEKIAKVVIANIDPNPKVSGRGVKKLRDAGIQVVTGVEAEAGAYLNRRFFTSMSTGRPFVCLKVAQSIDGRIASSTGKSKWITGQAARQEVHKMRASYDAVLVGIGTVTADNPMLTVRDYTGPSPLRVILDSSLSIPEDAQVLWPENSENTLIITTNKASLQKAERISMAGARVIYADSGEDGKVDLSHALSLLGDEKITSVLVEGGSRVFTSYVKQNLFDQLDVFISGKLMGTGLSWLGDLGTEHPGEAVTLQDLNITQFEKDIRISGLREKLGTFDSIQEEACLPG